MKTTNVIALFCEDIREEKGGSMTLIGVFRDNINFAPQPDPSVIDAPDIPKQGPEALGMITKLWIFLRVNFDPNSRIKEAAIRLVMQDGKNESLGRISQESFDEARKSAKEKKNLLAGLITRVMLTTSVVKQGSIKVEVDMDGETYLAGSLNFQPKAEGEQTLTTSANAQ